MKWPQTHVTVHEQIRDNAQKCENTLYSQRHNSGTTMNPELLPGMAVIEG